MTDYASAKHAYTSSSVMTAPPQKLVVMLYDGAIRFLRQSATAMRTGNREVTVNRLNRAGAIIDELNISLDMNQGEVASNLRSIYLFDEIGRRIELMVYPVNERVDVRRLRRTRED